MIKSYIYEISVTLTAGIRVIRRGKHGFSKANWRSWQRKLE